MTSDDFTYHGEALLLSWSDSTAGRKVTFLLPDEGTEHPFKGHKTGPKYGQAFALICKPVDYDNPEQPKAGDPVKSVAGYAKKPLSESQRCGMMCADQRFQAWLHETNKGRWEDQVAKYDRVPRIEEIAGGVVRSILGINSRKTLDGCGPEARPLKLWQELVSKYESDTGLTAEPRR